MNVFGMRLGRSYKDLCFTLFKQHNNDTCFQCFCWLHVPDINIYIYIYDVYIYIHTYIYSFICLSFFVTMFSIGRVVCRHRSIVIDEINNMLKFNVKSVIFNENKMIY